MKKMPTYNNQIIIKIFLFLSMIAFSSEISERYYNRANYNDICSNADLGCYFTVSNNYPTSPKIPTSIISDAILSDYRYIYLIFSIPNEQTNKNFYLEAYDTSIKETIISNGDCYFIDTTQNAKYEIRIFKKLKENSFIRFGFFGLSDNFEMTVNLEFKLNHLLYFTDIALSSDNSLYKANQPSLVKYFEEFNKKMAEQKQRKMLAKQTINKIVENVFSSNIDITLFDEDFFDSETLFVPPCLTLTASYSVGVEISTDKLFNPEKYLISETKVVEGKIGYHSDGLNLLDGKINVDNKLYKLSEAYNKKISNLILEFGIETDNYILTVSTNANFDCLIYTMTYLYGDTKAINYEIEIKIEIDNQALKEKVNNQVKSYESVYSNLSVDSNIIKSIILALVMGGISILTGGGVLIPIY